jgi:hypothetical protein
LTGSTVIAEVAEFIKGISSRATADLNESVFVGTARCSSGASEARTNSEVVVLERCARVAHVVEQIKSISVLAGNDTEFVASQSKSGARKARSGVEIEVLGSRARLETESS